MQCGERTCLILSYSIFSVWHMQYLYAFFFPLQLAFSNIIYHSKSSSDCLVQVPYTPDKDMFSKDSIYGDFCVDDADLAFENYEELFGTSHIQTEQLFDDAGIDSYFEPKEVPAGNSTEVCSLLTHTVVFFNALQSFTGADTLLVMLVFSLFCQSTDPTCSPPNLRN